MLSRSGPLGALALLFTPGAMVLAQTVLATPIITDPKRAATELLASYKLDDKDIGTSNFSNASGIR